MGKLKYIVATCLLLLVISGCGKQKEVQADNESMEEYALNIYKDISLNQQKESNSVEFLTSELGEPSEYNNYIGSTYAQWLIGDGTEDTAVLQIDYKDDVPNQAVLTFTKPHEQLATKKELKQKIESIPEGKKMSLDSLMTLFGMPRVLRKVHDDQGTKEYYEFDHNIDQGTKIFVEMIDSKVMSIEEIYN